LQSTNFHIDIQTTLPTFRQKLEEKLGGLLTIPIGLLILIVGVPIFIIVIVLYIYPKHLYDKFILGKATDEEDTELEIEVWTKLYQEEKIEIESLEIYPENEFDDTRWNSLPLMKLRTIPDSTNLNGLYFLTESVTFGKSLILFQVDKDVEVKQTQIIQFDLITLEMKIIEQLDDFYTPTFNMPDKETLIILCKQGHKKVEITLRTK
jgi:hypothetical protein